jgi:cytidyltransferase-like protein
LGHIRHLQEAARLGNWLVVSVSADRHVKKGMGRPRFSAEQRAEAVRALQCVDEVIINDDDGAWELIRRLKPAFYVKGIDYVGVTENTGLEKEKQAIAEVGGQMKFTGGQKWSSSQLLKTETFSDEVCEYLDRMKAAGARDKILEAFDAADQKRILFVGETILDIYRYVQGLGRASKELMLATVEVGAESFEGGVLAAAKHGEWKNCRVLTDPSGLSKTRYVDVDFKRKIFDVYQSREIAISEHEREHFRSDISAALGSSDVAVVNDFGHGLFGAYERSLLNGFKFLALNCQTNAGNYGFNLVTKYPMADYVCIDDPEARLAAGVQKEPILRAVDALQKSISCGRFLITHGRYGSHWFQSPHSNSAPALAIGGIDTMGAGDAVMAVTAPLVAAGLDMACAALVGNIVGAIKVSILGHRRHVGRQEIIQTVEALLA